MAEKKEFVLCAKILKIQYSVPMTLYDVSVEGVYVP